MLFLSDWILVYVAIADKCIDSIVCVYQYRSLYSQIQDPYAIATMCSGQCIAIDTCSCICLVVYCPCIGSTIRTRSCLCLNWDLCEYGQVESNDAVATMNSCQSIVVLTCSIQYLTVPCIDVAVADGIICHNR